MTQIQNQQPRALVDTVAVRVRQYDRELFVFSLRASKVHDLIVSKKMDIDRWKPDNQDGYQRDPVESRYRKFGKFVAVAKGISPTAMLVSLRNRKALEVKEIPGGNEAAHLIIHYGGEMLYVPDGQHRAYGLRWAVEEYPGQCEDYQVPVVLFVADGEDPRFEEATQFYTINNYAKRVKTDLAQRYILRKREKELGQLTENVTLPFDVPRSELLPYSVKIADLVNGNGPLASMISPPNTNSPGASISQNSFVESIMPLVQRAAEAHWDIGKTVAVINAFWNAIKSQCPKAFEHWTDDGCRHGDPDHFSAVLATTAGMFSLNDVLTRSLLLPDVAPSPTNPETYKKIFDKLEDPEFDDDYWKTPDGPAASHGTGRKSFREIADEIWENIVGGG